MRYAIYFTPPKESPLTRLAASWLGRDPFSGATVQPPATAALNACRDRFPLRRRSPLRLSRAR